MNDTVKLSRRLRLLTSNSNKYTYPDERDNMSAFTLVCKECGECRVFVKETRTRCLVSAGFSGITIVPNRRHDHRYSNINIALSNHFNTGLGSLLKQDEKILFTCGNCNSDNVALYGDILLECYQNQCPGCFACGGGYRSVNIKKICVECLILYRSLVKKHDLMFSLDMDLFCDSCPISIIRADQRIDPERIKNEVCGINKRE